MRIMLLGAGGFIGRHILAELLDQGHDVVAVVRRVDGLGAAFPQARLLALDLATMTDAADWGPHLRSVDAVVNAAGLLRGREMQAIHVAMPRALHAACAQAGVRRVVLISAISARTDVDSAYSRSKLQGEDDLRRTDLAWTVLRPSLVYGDGSYGGTSLVRGLAGLPWFIPLPGDGSFEFSPIHARDMARTVKLVCEDIRFIHTTLEPAGPETLTLRELLENYRGWLGFGKPRFVSIPMPVLRILGRLGDLLGSGPIATNSLTQLIAGNLADGERFARSIGFCPRSLHDALRVRPAQVQDRWHARLYFLAPTLTAVLVAMWLASALLGLLFGRQETLSVVDRLGLPTYSVHPVQFGASLLDLGIAVLLFADRTGRWSTPAQVVVVLGYTLVIGLTLPQLWLDPLGPLMKNLPILCAILVNGAIRNRR